MSPNLRLLTADQVAEQTGLTRRAVYRATTNEGLPVVRIGRSVKIRESDLLDWLDARTEKCNA